MEALFEVLKSGRWGTISPKSIEAAEHISSYMNKQYGLCLHSLSAALEALLRSLNIGYGDQVIVASYGNPINPMVISSIGAEPIFADIDIKTCTLSIESAKENITERTKAIVVDSYAGECGDLKELALICIEKGIYLIENISDEFTKTSNSYACATILDIGSKSSLNVGLGAALVTDNKEIYQAAFAYHNCGRVPGEVNNLKVEDFVGGNLRIAEWQSCLVAERINAIDDKLDADSVKSNELKEELSCTYLSPLRSFNDRIIFVYDKEKNKNIPKSEYIKNLNEKGINAKQQYVSMHKQPFFYSDYFKKLTGCDSPHIKYNLSNSILAEDNLLWVFC